jgi:large subunit ribosomal protein L35
MPKIKTNRGASKRVRVTASGKLKRRHAFKSHIAASKNPKRKRQLRQAGLIAESDTKMFAQLLPNL